MLILAIALETIAAGDRLLVPGRLVSGDCVAGDRGDVVVCATPRDRYRLPLPVEREAATRDRRSDGGTALAAITPAGRCGIFAGERRCSKAEARQHGYGGGRDPISVLTRLGTKLIHPDAEPSTIPQPLLDGMRAALTCAASGQACSIDR